MKKTSNDIIAQYYSRGDAVKGSFTRIFKGDKKIGHDIYIHPDKSIKTQLEELGYTVGNWVKISWGYQTKLFKDVKKEVP